MIKLSENATECRVIVNVYLVTYAGILQYQHWILRHSGFPFQHPSGLCIISLHLFLFPLFFLVGSELFESVAVGFLGRVDATRWEPPPARSAACPSGCRPASRGSQKKKVKPIVYPLAAGPAARSEGGHCSTLPRQCCHMGNRRNSNLQPTKSKANKPASYAEQWSLRVSCF